MRVLRSLLAIFVVGALSLTFTACGGDDGGSALSAGNDDKTADEATDDTTDSADDTADDTTDDSSSDDSGDGIGDFCLNEEFMAAAANVGLDENSDDPEDLAKFFDEMADEVPNEISDDFQVYAEFFGEYLSVLSEFDGDFTKMASDPEAMAALEKLSDPKFEEASNNITAWMEANC